LGSVELEFGVTGEFEEGSFYQDLIGDYDEIRSIKVVEYLGDCANISIIRTNILEVIGIMRLYYAWVDEQVVDEVISP